MGPLRWWKEKGNQEKTFEVIESGPLSPGWSAQACELYAILKALQLLKGFSASGINNANSTSRVGARRISGGILKGTPEGAKPFSNLADQEAKRAALLALHLDDPIVAR